MPILIAGCGRTQKVTQPADRAQEAAEAGEMAEVAQRAAEFADYEPKPLPADQDTGAAAREFAEARVALLRRFSVDLYKEMGLRDPAWDDEALAVLEAYARREADAPDAPSGKEALRLARALADTECKDPLALMAAGITAYEDDRIWEAQELLFFSGAMGPDTPGYPDLATWRKEYVGYDIFCRTGDHPTNDPDDQLDVLATEIGVGLDNVRMEGMEPRALFTWLYPAVDRLDNTQRLENLIAKVEHIEDAAEKGYHNYTALDPWFEHTLLGVAELKLGWAYRGPGAAVEVSEKGAAGFREHSGKAREHLEKAWEIRQDWPEPAAYMIDVAMGQGSGQGELRAWFDRAVAAQFDCMRAYYNLMWALMPRWGGSHEAVWELGVECLETGRFDTDVPYMLMKAAEYIAEKDGHLALWKREDAHRRLVEMFEGYLAEPDSEISEACIRTWWAGAAWRGEWWEEAREQLALVGEDLDAKALDELCHTAPATLRTDVAVHTSPQADAISEADAALAAGDIGEAETLYRQVMQAAGSQEVSDYAGQRLAGMRVERAMAEGETIELVPGIPLGRCHTVNGKWETADDGSLVLHPEGEGGFVLFPGSVEDNYRMTVHIEFPPDDDRFQAGIVFSWPDPMAGFGAGCENLMADRYNHFLQPSGSRLGPQPRHEVHVNRTCALTLEVYRQTVAAYLDGRKLLQGRALKEWYEEPERQLVGVTVGVLGDVTDPLRIRKVTLEPLSEQPEDWVKPVWAQEGPAPGWAGEERLDPTSIE
ncbi:MAG: hypothetical protein U9R79_00590 [Armatimonadota bacterium]|nr:hypothetical protein [Armatimonadota bacterium]